MGAKRFCCPKRHWRLVVWLMLCLSGSTLTTSSQAQSKPRSAAELMDVVMWNREPIGGPFRLTDHTGKVRRDTDFRGRLMLVYFGYTTCPDVCPTDLQQIAQALNLLGPQAVQVAPVFITLDPQRDTKELLSQYVPGFHPQMIGLRGTEAEVYRVAEAYKVFHQKVPVRGWLRYTIDHSSYVFLMGKDGRYLGFLPPNTSAERMVAVVQGFLNKTP